VPPLIGEADDELVQALTEWSSRRGWGLTRIQDEAIVAGGSSLPAGARALVSTTALDVTSLTSARPDMVAVVLDQEAIIPGPRVSTVGMPGARRDQAGFLAGVMAGLVGDMETVYLVSGTGDAWEAVYVGAFEHGVRYSCPKCSVIQLQAGGLASSVSQQTNVVFVVPGPEAAAAAGEAIALGARWIVWIGEGPEGVDPSRLAGRVMFARDELVAQALEALLSGGAGRTWPYTVENGGIQFSDIRQEAISPGRLRWVEEAYQLLASGELDPGVDPMTGAGP